ncbi:MAG: glycogen/starch synthase, partial [Bacilli bacterium]|nr:glycogen/starch synthase [Bacilli bacterium]
MKEKTICFVVSECLGFAETGGLAEVAGSLPKAIQTV